jgi:flavodoxin II
MNIGLFYGSSTCYTEMAAEKIRDIIGPELVTLHNLKDDAVALMEQYDVLILGIPTWDLVNTGRLGSHLGSARYAQSRRQNHCHVRHGRSVGLRRVVPGRARHAARQTGAERRYVYRLLANRRLRVHQQKPIIADGQLFVGLALDETNQYDLSDERLQNWCEQILGEMAEKFS